MNKRTEFSVRCEDGVYYVSGRLDEHASLAALPSTEEHIRINLKNLGEINSYGLRKLLTKVHEIGGKRFSYFDCPPNFIDVVNIVPALLGITKPKSGMVVSLFVPYECIDCDHTENVLMATDACKSLAEKTGGSAVLACPKCSKEMIIYMPDYFSFLMHQ